MQAILEDAAGIYRDGDSLTKATEQLRELKERAAVAAIDDASHRFNTERVAGLELAGMLELAECHRPQRPSPRGVARRAPAHRLPRPRRRTVPRPFTGAPRARRLPARVAPAGHHHPLAAGQAGLREVTWSDQITLAVVRYRPDEEDAEPVLADYEVPLRRDWAILDALNHIKDEIDGTLSYRWSCRMGICGSCGMMINGEPKLTCATFLVDLAPGPVRIEPLANFPVIRDLIVDITDFMHKLGRVKPWLIRDEERPVEDGEYLQTPGRARATSSSSACASTACSATRPARSTGWTATFIGPAAIALAHRYNLDSRDEGDRERLTILAQPDGVWDCTFVGECSTACPKGVDPAGAIQQAKLAAAQEAVKSLLLPWRSR